MAKTSTAAKRVPRSVSRPTMSAAASEAIVEHAAAPVPVASVAVEAAMAAKPGARKARAAASTAARKSAKVVATASPDAAPDKPAKPHKTKLVRDSFTIPKDEYHVLDVLKRRALGLEHPVRKSELLRAGIKTLAAMNDKALLKALSAVPTLKTGRPKSS